MKREVALGELLELVIDHRGKTPRKLGGDFVDAGVPVVSAIHIKDGRIKWDERRRFVTPEMYERWMPVKLRRGDLLLTSEAPCGQTALVPSDDNLVLSQRLFALRGKPGLLDSAYLMYFLRSEEGQRRLLARTTGTTVVGIRQSELMQVSIPIPPFEMQVEIADALSSLDELIETDRSLAVSIESTLALEFANLAFDTAGPGAVPLSSLVDINPAYPKPVGDTAAYIDMASLPTESALVGRVARRPAGGGARFMNGDTVMARITPCLENGKTAFVDALTAGEVAVGSTEFIVMRSRPPLHASWTYFLARSPRFRDHVVRHMTGSSGRQRCPASVVENYLLDEPSAAAIARFDDLADRLFPALRELNDEADTARGVRDGLLPLLLSGAIAPRSAVA